MHGYYSADAVRDLLAVKEGEIDYLKNKVRVQDTKLLYLETHCAALEEELETLRGPKEYD